MRRYILITLIILLSSIIATAQLTATNFTATDCSSNSHTLFTELDNGKIIVLVWVEPCAGCINDAKAAYDAAQSFASSNPGKVLYYLCDDIGNTSCSSLSSWASTNGIGPSNLTVFDNTGNVIDESNYGGFGMPHVVVMGGGNHKIYFNKLNGSNDGAAIQNAINTAITTSAQQVNNIDNFSLKIYPNPSRDQVSFDFTLGHSTEVTIEVTNIIGAKIKTIALGKQTTGKHSLSINSDGSLSNGVYFLKIITGSNYSQIARFVIAN